MSEYLTPPTLGQQIRRNRLLSRKSLAKVAEEVGVTASYISRLENNLANNPSHAILRKLEAALSFRYVEPGEVSAPEMDQTEAAPVPSGPALDQQRIEQHIVALAKKVEKKLQLQLTSHLQQFGNRDTEYFVEFLEHTLTQYIEYISDLPYLSLVQQPIAGLGRAAEESARYSALKKAPPEPEQSEQDTDKQREVNDRFLKATARQPDSEADQLPAQPLADLDDLHDASVRRRSLSDESKHLDSDVSRDPVRTPTT